MFNLNANIVTTETSFRTCVSVLNEMWLAFDLHRHENRTLPNGNVVQVHKTTDSTNAMLIGDVATAPIQTVYDSANSLVTKLRNHAFSEEYHVYEDPQSDLSYTQVSDMASLSSTIEKLCSFFDSHTNNSGIHTGNGEIMRNAVCGDVIVVKHQDIMNNTLHVGYMKSENGFIDLRNGRSVKNTNFQNFRLFGVSDIPRMSGVLPRSGIEGGPGGRLTVDKVEIFFSKPMCQTDLTNAFSITAASGDDPEVSTALWTSESSATLSVNNMHEVYCSIDVIGLEDSVGNPIS